MTLKLEEFSIAFKLGGIFYSFQINDKHKSALRDYEMMLKKRSTDFCPKKNCFGRAVEGLFLSKAGPKRGWLSYLIAIIRKETSDLWRITLNVIRYKKYPLFGPALDKKEPSTTRPKKRGLFFGQLNLFCQLTFFFSIKY